MGIPGFTAWIPQWEIAEKKSWNSALFNNITRTADNDRGYIIFLKIPGYQTHGLVAYRSKPRKDHSINTVLPAPLENLRRINIQRLALAVIRGNAIKAG